MGYYDFLGYDPAEEEMDTRECVHCHSEAWVHIDREEEFNHPFIANNLELLEWKSKQWEDAHPGMVLA